MTEDTIATLCITVTVLAVPLYLGFEKRGNRRGKTAVKPFASLGFIGLALASGAARSTAGILILAGLLCCAAGDVFLLSRGRGLFLAGLGSFLAGHILYCAAFLSRNPAPEPILLTAALLIPPAVIVWRWLRPHLKGGLTGPVLAYVIVISVMAALAVGAAGAGFPVRIVPGAFAFYLSDLAVARDRFVRPGFWNRLWGLPLYYLGQLLIASCAGG